jgi:hypothetical protein
MRAIEHDMIAAIKCRDSFNKDNTQVVQCTETCTAKVSLFKNTIAVISYYKGTITLDDCGYRTNTTKSRLNALLDMLTCVGGGQGIYQKAGVWYWREGEEWTGTATVRLVL